MKVLKFGGKSLANGKGLQNVIHTIKNKIKNQEEIVVVVSARGNTTAKLEEIYEKSVSKQSYSREFNEFVNYQLEPFRSNPFKEEFLELGNYLKGIYLLNENSEKHKDAILGYGEIISAKAIALLLKEENISANFVDSRKLFVTDNSYGNAKVQLEESTEKVTNYFQDWNKNTIPVVTGFIASSTENKPTTLGKNGSNYSATLLANILNAQEVENYTHIDGVYSANPELVAKATKIGILNYKEASVLANYGATILHPKTINPLKEKQIPLRILNTFNQESEGTLIRHFYNDSKFKSINCIENVSLLQFSIKDFESKSKLESLVFQLFFEQNIEIFFLNQTTLDIGIEIVLNNSQLEKAIETLESNFESYNLNIENSKEVCVLTTVGEKLENFHKALESLAQHQIQPLLINNTISGNNICLVVEKNDKTKAINIIHQKLFHVAKKINIAVFGKGNVGKALIDQLVENKKSCLKRRNLEINIFAILDSKNAILNEDLSFRNWQENFNTNKKEYKVADVISFAKENHLENLIAIDNTANKEFTKNYQLLIENGFHIVASNKIANTLSVPFYNEIRQKLKKYNKHFLYETNVGAGLPLIDTIKLLHDSGEDITRIRGIFSGSLSYIFNEFSEKNIAFSEVLNQAILKGFTEPDAREDLSGNDVARKLLILARELELEKEFSEIQIKNLLPETFQQLSIQEFYNQSEALNPIFEEIKQNQKENHVLRYVGDLHGDLSKTETATLNVDLVSVPKTSALGTLKGADSIFEIYTKSYGENPIIIQGAGAGAEVTARGVFGDILKLSEKI
ncbi:aspartate kinase [Aureivirga sp. CE67]|uniref:aspartate kinase n=1 Tax=Aureivirga sp. CE67 TaxID=1788983 RepID=UPI001E423129|nr:aspartate kinase [Aureivirga sp. CE67]